MSWEAIRRTLTHHVGGAADASAVAEATINTWHQVSAQFSPMIGSRGVDVLFRRSLHLTSTIFPWLAIAGDSGDSSALLANLKTRLAGRETNAAAEASYTLLETFTKQLTTLIGESLTEHLLAPVWAHPARLSSPAPSWTKLFARESRASSRRRVIRGPVRSTT